MKPRIDRRRFIATGSGALGGLLLAGCDRVTESDWGKRLLGSVDEINRRLQRLLSGRAALAREFSEAEISPVFKANGNTDPGTPAYAELAQNNFADYRLEIA